MSPYPVNPAGYPAQANYPAAYGYPQGYPQAMQYPQGGQSYGQPAQQPQQQTFSNHINWCQGVEGAKAFYVPRGESAQIMDSEGPYFYIKSVDMSGIPAPLRTFRYQEEFIQQAQAAGPQHDYVTRQELPSLIAQALQTMQRDGGSDNA